MRVLVAANPRSGGSTDPDEVASLLRGAGADVAACTLDELTAQRVREAGAARVVVAGGDGSVGPAAACAAEAGVPLAVVATGTANDFARAAGLPLDLEEACALAADPDAPTQAFEVARMDARPFVNVATAGLSVAAAEAAAPLKPRLGPAAYAAGAARAAASEDPVELAVEVDGAELFAGEAWQLAVAATGAFGGGSEVGGTVPDDGQLDVVVVADRSRLALVRRAIGMRRGTLHAQDGVVTGRGREVVVRGPDAFNVDGELCDCAAQRATRFTADARHVEVVVPRAA